MKVELIEVFGSDEMVCNAARVSFGKLASNYSEKSNKGLINYLATHNHISPFFHPQLQFRIECPIYVERQLQKTQVGVAINSISGRYVDFSDTYTHITEWRKQSESSKQGSEGLIDDQQSAFETEYEVIEYCKEAYQKLISLGVCKEQARTILPLCLNTQFIWTGSLAAFIRLCKLRLKPDAQVETKEVVAEMLLFVAKLEGNPFKMSLEAFELCLNTVQSNP